MPTLTHAEAIDRRALIDVVSYRVDLDVSEAEHADTFTSRSTIRFGCAAPGLGTFLEVHARTLSLVELNGRTLDPALVGAGRVHLTDLAADNVVIVEGRFAYSRTGEGMHRFVDPEDGLTYLYSQTNLYDAQRVFACFEQPDLKAPFTLSVSAPPSWVVLGNTPGEQHSPGRWHFQPSQPLATYFAAIVAGPYHGVRGHHDGIDLGVWCRQSMARYLDDERMLATTAIGFDYFHDLFGVRYAFGKYDQVLVPEFNLGAMENPGLVTYRDELFLPRGTITEEDREDLAGVQLHEMAHMWFGNLVTMQWWDDLWLNESFAEYLAHRSLAAATAHTGAWTTFAVRRKAWGYLADQLSTTHPVAGAVVDTDEALQNFDGISYAKGAAALRQLVEWVGDEAFLGALRAYFADHAFANATLADLVGALSLSSGRDVGGWADAWLRTAGVSTLEAEFDVGADGTYTAFRVHQQVPAALPHRRPHRIGIGLYDRVGDRLTRRSLTTADVAAAEITDVHQLRGKAAADLVLLNDGDLTFALVSLDERSLSTVRADLALVEDPLARTLLWNAVWELVSQGHLAPSLFVHLLVRSLGQADPDVVAGMVLRRAVTAADWSEPARHSALLQQLADLTRTGAAASVPGGDTQLLHARTWAQVSDDVQALRGWLADEGLPAGLVVDDDLRWRVVQRLAVLGAADDDLVATERRRDPSSSGHLHALTATASMPTVQAKDDAWRRATDGSLSNHELVAVAQGFWRSEQADLLRPYAERFGAQFPALAATGSPEVVRVLGRLMFPTVLLEPGTLAMAESLLDGDRLSAGPRRIVAERRDEVERGLRARAADR